MRRIESKIRTSDSEFQANRAHNQKLAEELALRMAQARAGGPEESQARHKERGKMLARERIDALTDPGTPFLEL